MYISTESKRKKYLSGYVVTVKHTQIFEEKNLIFFKFPTVLKTENSPML